MGEPFTRADSPRADARGFVGRASAGREPEQRESGPRPDTISALAWLKHYGAGECSTPISGHIESRLATGHYAVDLEAFRCAGRLHV